MYINTPGGQIYSGLAIVDTMKYIKCDISTIAIGIAASMGSVLLAMGTKGKRYALPNSKILIHQPLGGVQGQASDIAIEAEEILQMKSTLNSMLAKATGQKKTQIEKDADRDKYFTAKEAKEYGLIDKVVKKR
jgi:ATP-dependent Clp protease protease subunit